MCCISIISEKMHTPYGGYYTVIIYSYQKKYGLDAFTQSDSHREKALEEKQKETAGMQEMYDRLREEDRKCTEALKAAQKR